MNEMDLKTTTAPAQPREWVTPVFEQIALKDALSGNGADSLIDLDTTSS